MTTDILLGDEAVALAGLHAGIGGAFSYPGTPATEIFEYVMARSGEFPGVSARWSANEKVAYEEALGMSFAGRRALISMKHVGLNVAADPFINSALTGANGGLVLVVADDPGMHSSQNEQDSRYYAEFAQIPALEPANQQEAYDLTRFAFDYSERVGLPVMVRLVTRLAHSRGNVRTQAPTETQGARPRPSAADWTLLPVNARRRFKRLVDLQPEITADAEQSQFNELHLHGKHGIIASGMAYNYVREVLGARRDEVSLLKIGHYPLPTKLLRELTEHVNEVLCVEDGYPFIERRLRGALGLTALPIRGRLSGELPPTGELTPDLVARALACATPGVHSAVSLASRPPQLCNGCPHAETFQALTAAVQGHRDAILFSDIGCYTLGALPPFNAVHSCVDMGASIAMAHGAAQAGAYPVIATIGDSTFTHSGMTPLLGAARADADMTVIILDNATVAMTGCQSTLATGERLDALLLGLGVPESNLHVVTPMARKQDELVALLRQSIAHHGLSVIVARRPCIHAKRKSDTASRSTREPSPAV